MASRLSTSHFSWGHDGLTIEFTVSEAGVISMHRFLPSEWEATNPPRLDQPTNLVEVRTVEHGSVLSGNRSTNTAIGARLQYRGHDIDRSGDRHRLAIHLADDVSRLGAELQLESADGSRWVSGRTRIVNNGNLPVRLLAVSSLVLEVPLESREDISNHRMWWARNEWLAECRWESSPARPTLLPDSDRILHPIDNRSGLVLSSLAGGWSTSRYLPVGMLQDEHHGLSYAWQVESLGGWRWEVADRLQSLYVATFGPTDRDHSWSVVLAPGEEFSSVSTTVGVSADGWQGAMRSLNRARQDRRLPNPSFESRPIVFNDYMNAIHGDPTEEKLLPLIDAAAAAGAEVFCIDAGWFDDGPSWWWDSLGEYRVSPRRFPHGIDSVFDRMRGHGMTPGIWVEPEVVGVRSPLAGRLPKEAFLQRGGQRVVEHDRYHLDFRHPAARAHVDEVVDRLVSKHGVGYLKFDYNIDPGPGTDVDADSPGDGMVGHQRAFVEWLRDLASRYPDLIIMNCASGGMRMDGEVQRYTHVQQLTDQQNFRLFIPIAVARATAVPPDQAASWAYPDKAMSQDEVEFCLVAPLLTRFELSGQIDGLNEAQRAATVSAVEVYQHTRKFIGDGEPFWPWGLPRWHDEWLAVGLRCADRAFVSVWRRDGEIDTAHLSVPEAQGLTTVRALFPGDPSTRVQWDPTESSLAVTLPRPTTAVLLEFVDK